MAWNKSGDERVKSYRIYKELEEKYRSVEAERDFLLAQIRLKDATIRNLAAELAGAPLGDALRAATEAEQAGMATDIDSAPESPVEPNVAPAKTAERRHDSGVVPAQRPGLAKTIPLSQQLGGQKRG